MAKQQKPPVPPTWESAAAELDRIAELDDDWDHEGAQAPWSATIKKVKDWLDFFHHFGTSRPPTIKCGLNRNILMQWQAEKGWFEIEFDQTGGIHATHVPAKGHGVAWHSEEL